MFSLQDRTAVITGAAGLIGQAIASTMLKQGANVVLLDVNENALKSASAKMASCIDGAEEHIDWYVCDVTNQSGVDATVMDIINKRGKIDILVNNAGVTRDCLFARMSIDDYDIVMNINLRSAFIMTQQIMPNMISNRYGRIVNISSIVGFVGNIGQANYCASKAGMVGMTKAIAQEVARRNITVNCIAPGFIKSAMTDKLSENIMAKLIDKIPSGAIGTSQDVANAVCFIASNEASYITGQTIHVNGGMAMI